MKAIVETVQLVASNGRKIRKVTRVRIGLTTITFTERMTKKAAIAAAFAEMCR